MVSSSPTVFGAAIEHREASPDDRPPGYTPTLDLNESSATSPPSKRFSATDAASKSSNPFSAFYQHPHTRSSLERAKADSRTRLPLMTDEQIQSDLEKGTASKQQPRPPQIIVTEQPPDNDEGDFTSSVPQTRDTSTDGGSRSLGDGSVDGSTDGTARPKLAAASGYSSMWPTRQELEEKALVSKRERMRRNWNCLSGLSKRQRIWVRVLIAVLIIGAAVGIGVGVSMAVGGGVYQGDGQQGNIDGDD